MCLLCARSALCSAIRVLIDTHTAYDLARLVDDGDGFADAHDDDLLPFLRPFPRPFPAAAGEVLCDRFAGSSVVLDLWYRSRRSGSISALVTEASRGAPQKSTLDRQLDAALRQGL